MRAANAGVRGRRWRLAAALSLAPLLLFLFLTTGYSNGLAPEVRPREGEGSSSSIENTVVIPSYHEAPNIAPLVTWIFAAVDSPSKTEVVIVDDNSQDGTVEAVERLRGEGYNVVLVVRTDASGLSSAVLRGFKEARGSKFVVMDGASWHTSGFAPPTQCVLLIHSRPAAPARERPTLLQRAEREHAVCDGHALWTGWGCRQGLADVPQTHECRCAQPRAAPHVRLRSHVRVLWSHPRARASSLLLCVSSSHLYTVRALRPRQPRRLQNRARAPPQNPLILSCPRRSAIQLHQAHPRRFQTLKQNHLPVSLSSHGAVPLAPRVCRRRPNGGGAGGRVLGCAVGAGEGRCVVEEKEARAAEEEREV